MTVFTADESVVEHEGCASTGKRDAEENDETMTKHGACNTLITAPSKGGESADK